MSSKQKNIITNVPSNILANIKMNIPTTNSATTTIVDSTAHAITAVKNVSNNVINTVVTNEPIVINEEIDVINDNSENNKIIELKKKVLDEIIVPDIKDKLLDCIWKQKMWNFMAGVMIFFKYICMFVNPLISFASLITWLEDYRITIIFVSGLLQVLTIMFDQFGNYFSSNSKKSLADKNKLLDSLGIKYREPDTTVEDVLSKKTDDTEEKNKTS